MSILYMLKQCFMNSAAGLLEFPSEFFYFLYKSSERNICDVQCFYIDYSKNQSSLKHKYNH